MRKLLVIATAVCVAAIGAGCSDSGSSADDQALADKVVLRKSDLPDGWAANPATEGEVELPECRAINRANERAGEGAKAESPNLSDPTDPNHLRQIESTVYVFGSEGEANGYFNVYASDPAVACFETLGETISAQLGGGVPVSVRQPQATVKGADAVTEYRVVVGPSGDPTQSVFQNILVVRVGRVVAGFFGQNIGGDFPEGNAALTAVLDRINKAT